MTPSSIVRMTPKTATSPHFSADELALISESLRIASAEITESAVHIGRIWSSPLVERMLIAAEAMLDIKARIDGA